MIRDNNRLFLNYDDGMSGDSLDFNLTDVYQAEINLRQLQNDIDSNISSLLTFENSDSNIDTSGFESKISCARGNANCLGFQESIKRALERTIKVRNAILTAEGTNIEDYEKFLEMNLENFGEISELVDENGNVILNTSQDIDVDAYVHDLLYDENGNPKYPGMTIVTEPVVLPNGSIQVTINVVEDSRSSSGAQRNNDITITFNPQYTDRVFTLAPGTNGNQFYDLVNSNAANNNFTTVSYSTAPSDTTRSDAVIADILFESNGNHNLDTAVIAGASAGATSTVNMYGELMDIVDGPITIMLLDPAYDGRDFNSTLLDRPDVVNHMKENGNVIISYESTAPDAADSNWQDLADQGLTVVMCVNDDLSDHSGNNSPEMQIVNGELKDIMDPNPSSSNPLFVVHDDTPKSPATGQDNSGNKYGIYSPGGNGVYSGGSIQNPAGQGDVLGLIN